jgi:hypothetical protein
MLRRFIFALVCAVLAASSALGQNFTAVSGTIVDPNGLPYSNCAITAELVPSGTNPTIGGASIGGLNRASCDVNGVFSMTLGSNAVILPGGTQWKFTVNESPGIPPPGGFGPQSFVATLTISGASQDISASLAVPALALGRSGAAGPVGGIGVTAQDFFIRANGPIGSNWSKNGNGLTITGNNVTGAAAGQASSSFWVANSFTPIQFSQWAAVTLNGTTDSLGPTILNQANGANYYDCVENTTTLTMRKVVNGVPSTLASTSITGQKFDTIRLEIWPGSILVCNLNFNPLLTASDSTFTLGSPGIEVIGNVATGGQWIAGNISGHGWRCTLLTPVTVNANVTADQNLFSCPLPPSGFAGPTQPLRVYLAGVYSTPAASTAAINVKAEVCAVSGCGSGTVVPFVSITSAALGGIQATNNPFTLEVISSTIPSTGLNTFEVHGKLSIGLSASQSAAQAVFADNNTAPIGGLNVLNQLFLQITIAFSSASASNSATARALIVGLDAL